jgi:hypothetical protein
MSDNARTDFDSMPQFEEARAGWIGRARAAARRIAAEKGQVTINDVRDVCPPPEGADPRIMGAVLHKGEFTRVDFMVSERRRCHGRTIGVFRLKGTGASAQPVAAACGRATEDK